MKSRWMERTLIASVALIAALLFGRFMDSAPATAAAPSAPQGSGPTAARFINFDIGAATVRSGAKHQDFINKSAPYVELPATGYPLTLLNFTVPPDYADGSDFDVRVLFSVAPTACDFVLEADLVGYGPGHSAASFDVYWPGEASPSDVGVVSAPIAYDTHAVIITFDPSEVYRTFPGDAMTLILMRMTEHADDACGGNVLIRSVSITYQGWMSYLPVMQR